MRGVVAMGTGSIEATPSKKHGLKMLRSVGNLLLSRGRGQIGQLGQSFVGLTPISSPRAFSTVTEALASPSAMSTHSLASSIQFITA